MPTIGRIVLVLLINDSRWMPGVIVEVRNAQVIKIRIFHPDGDGHMPTPVWVTKETKADRAVHAGGRRDFARWKWPPRAGATS